MKKLIASVAILAMTLALVPVNLIAAGRQQNQTLNGEISGTALQDGKPLPKIEVRLRNIDNNEIISKSTTGTQGEFKFTGLPAGNFVVETYVNGSLISTSNTIKLAAGAMIATGVTLNMTGTALAAAGFGTAGAAAAGGGALGAIGGTAGALAVAAGVVGVTTAIVVANDASGSQ